jgi:hypothetical protein
MLLAFLQFFSSSRTQSPTHQPEGSLRFTRMRSNSQRRITHIVSLVFIALHVCLAHSINGVVRAMWPGMRAQHARNIRNGRSRTDKRMKNVCVAFSCHLHVLFLPFVFGAWRACACACVCTWEGVGAGGRPNARVDVP